MMFGIPGPWWLQLIYALGLTAVAYLAKIMVGLDDE